MRFPQAVAPLVVAAVACLTGCGGRTTAAGGAPRVLLSSDRDGETRAYSVRPDGSRLTSLLPRSRALRPAAVSRDGGWIAYTDTSSDPAGNNDLVVVRPDGTHRHRVARDVGTFAWSPDGRRLAFSGHIQDVGVVDVDGRGLRRLGLSLDVGSEPWSTDGRRLALAAAPAGGPVQIWLVGSTGRRLRRITGMGHNELVGWTR